MGKLENDVRVKLDDDLFGWLNRECAAQDLPRRVFIVRQLKFVREVHDAMKQQRELIHKRFGGDSGGAQGHAGASPDYVSQITERKYSLSDVRSVFAHEEVTAKAAAPPCSCRCPFAHLDPDNDEPDSPAVPL